MTDDKIINSDAKTPRKCLKTRNTAHSEATTVAKTQASNIRPGKGGVIPPVERRFGQPNGNKQGRGFWKREDTPRYKLEQMMKMSEEELIEVVKDKDRPYFERKIAGFINKGDWKQIKEMVDEVYGTPKQEITQTNIELKPILPKPKGKE